MLGITYSYDSIDDCHYALWHFDDQCRVTSGLSMLCILWLYTYSWWNVLAGSSSPSKWHMGSIAFRALGRWHGSQGLVEAGRLPASFISCQRAGSCCLIARAASSLLVLLLSGILTFALLTAIRLLLLQFCLPCCSVSVSSICCGSCTRMQSLLDCCIKTFFFCAPFLVLDAWSRCWQP